MKKYSNRVIILTQYYPPETGAPQNRLSDIAARFLQTGIDVRVLTAKPNYPQGKIYPGFEKGLCCETEQEGVPVTHCWIYASNRSLFHRLLNYFSFVVSSILVGIFKMPRADVVIVESPPLFLSFSGWMLSRIKGAKLVLNISDLYPETAISLGILKNSFLIKVFYLLETWSYKISSLVTCQTKGIMKSIQNRFPNKPLYLLTNGIDFEKFSRNNDDELRIDAKHQEDFIIGYAGILGYGQNLGIIAVPAKKLQHIPDIQFHIYGTGPLKNELSSLFTEYSLNNIHLLGHFPHSEIITKMEAWAIGLVPLADTALMKGALPSKMFELMAMKLPVLLIAPQGEASTIIEDAKAGIWVEPKSEIAIYDAILTLYRDQKLAKMLGENGFNFVTKHFNREAIFLNFVSHLQVLKLLP